MMITLLLLQLTISRPYHKVSIAQAAHARWTHVEVCGTVNYVRRQTDGDIHIRVTDGKVTLVGEVIPLIKLPLPRVGMAIRMWGISRMDPEHKWAEVHPVEGWEAVSVCPADTR
jgi:hypothetical protein